MEEDKLKERFEYAKKEISEAWNSFYVDTGFYITDINIKIIDVGSRCGPVFMLGPIDIKITR